MNAVGIDVSKGKSMMMALQPMNKVALKPKEYPHTRVGLEQMALAITSEKQSRKKMQKVVK